MSEGINREEFDQVVKFHGCYCLDIAMGYRVSKALVREMGDEMNNMKKVFGHIGANTCAVDGFQQITGCTLGKRNLILNDLGKPVYVLQNTQSGAAKRAYVHYWDHHDHTQMRAKRQAANAPDATEADKQAFQQHIDNEINAILQAPEEELFRITSVSLEAPPKSSKYKSVPCDQCGEFTKAELMQEKSGKRLCPECAG